jgi:hypothetical protein
MPDPVCGPGAARRHRRLGGAAGSDAGAPATAARLPLWCATGSARLCRVAAQALAAADVSASAERLAEFGPGNDLGLKAVGEMPEIGELERSDRMMHESCFGCAARVFAELLWVLLATQHTRSTVVRPMGSWSRELIGIDT